MLWEKWAKIIADLFGIIDPDRVQKEVNVE
jgi:hypothetical protein